MTADAAHDEVAGIALELRRWWRFDGAQQHTHSWHDREDFIEKKLPELVARLRAMPREPAQGWTTVTDDPATWPDPTAPLGRAVLIEFKDGTQGAFGECGLLKMGMLQTIARWMPWPSAAPSPPPLLALVREWAEAKQAWDDADYVTHIEQGNCLARLQAAEAALRRAAGGGA